MCDIDYFKIYNDEYGHLEGDKCLRQVAMAISMKAHRPGDLAARYGGEEFAVILSNTDTTGIKTVAIEVETEIDMLAIPNLHSGVSDHVTISIGGAVLIPRTKKNPKDLIALADHALYMAKNKGRNCIIILNAENHNEIIDLCSYTDNQTNSKKFKKI